MSVSRQRPLYADTQGSAAAAALVETKGPTWHAASRRAHGGVRVHKALAADCRTGAATQAVTHQQMSHVRPMVLLERMLMGALTGSWWQRNGAQG